jgi:sialate O-acetylesterase
MKKIIKLFFLVCVFFVFPYAMHAKISLPAFISEGMVLQQQTSASLWGKALSGKTITVRASWDNMNYSTKADKEGRWRIQLKTPQAGGPYFIVFSEGNDSLTLHDVWVGEVWLCSGQSNMEMPMKGFKNQSVEDSNMDILKSTNSQLRLFTVKRHSTLVAQEDVEGEWQTANPVSVSEFSATAYYFGRLLQEILKVPVGLICSSWGGSPIESWMDRDMLQSFPGIKLPQTEEDIKGSNTGYFNMNQRTKNIYPYLYFCSSTFDFDTAFFEFQLLCKISTTERIR